MILTGDFWKTYQFLWWCVEEEKRKGEWKDGIAVLLVLLWGFLPPFLLAID